MTEPIRLGVLGAARIAERAIVTPAKDTGARLVANAARDRKRADEYAEEHGIERVLDSYADVIADPEVEAIYNPLPNGLHGPWNVAAVQAGKHVLSEKLFASNAEEAAEVRDAAEAAGVVVLEGFHYLFHPVTQRLHELLESGELGELREVETVMVTPAPWGGGEPKLVAASGDEREGSPEVDQWLDADLEYPNGATGIARCNMAGQVLRMSCRILGSRGQATAANFVLPHLDDRVLVVTPAGDRIEQLGTTTSYTYQLEAFAARLRDDTPLPIGADDAVANMQLIDECYGAAGFEPRPRSE